MKGGLLLCVLVLGMVALPAKGFMPYSRSSLWDLMLPADDPFRILEQTPFPVPKGVENLALARADWKETAKAHVIAVDVPGRWPMDASGWVGDPLPRSRRAELRFDLGSCRGEQGEHQDRDRGEQSAADQRGAEGR